MHTKTEREHWRRQKRIKTPTTNGDLLTHSKETEKATRESKVTKKRPPRKKTKWRPNPPQK